MSRIATRLRAQRARRPTMELLVALLAGIGLGIGLAALIVGRGAQGSARNASGQVASSTAQRSRAGVRGGRARTSVPGAIAPSTGTSAGATSAPAAALDAGAASSFTEMASALPGRVELAVQSVGAGETEELGGNLAAHGWSTTKVPVLAALLRARREELTPQEQTWAQSAITESNNEAVLDLFHDLEQSEDGLDAASEYVQDLLRRSGDTQTVVATAPPPPGAVTTFGQTEWRPGNAVKFFAALARGCLLGTRATNYVLGLMQHIEPSESWGLGSAGLPRVAFKGGWGPEADGAYLVRQSGIVDVGSPRAVAVAIVAFPPAGAASFETGTTMLTQTATWLRAHLQLVSRARVPCS